MDALDELEYENRGSMNSQEYRILAVDPGEKNIGVAISDPSATLARPLSVIHHVSMIIDSAQIARLAEENQAGLIIVGLPTGSEGEEISQTRHAKKLIDSIQTQTGIPVIPWDEWGSTKNAKWTLIDAGISRSKRGGHQDAMAAAIILRSYLESKQYLQSTQNE